MSADAFFAPATHALEAEVEIEGTSMAPASLSLEEAFDVEATAQLIIDGGYKVVSRAVSSGSELANVRSDCSSRTSSCPPALQSTARS